MDEQPTNPTLDDNNDVQPQVTPQNAKEAAQAAATALAEAQFPDIKKEEPEAPHEAETETSAPAGQPDAETPQDTLAQAEPVAETAETPVEDVEEEVPALAPPAPVQPLDASKFVDENGYVDVKAMTEAFNQSLSQVQQTASSAAQRELNAQRLEERQWNQATEKYPQLKTDKSLRDIVQNARIGKTTELYQRAAAIPDPTARQQALAEIKTPSPTQIASELFKRLGEAKSEGVKAATEQVSIQGNARLETASTPGDSTTTTKKAELFNEIRNPDTIAANKAQRDLLKELLFSENEQ